MKPALDSSRSETLATRALRIGGVPEAYQDATWHECQNQVDLMRWCAAMQRRREDGRSLLFLGPVGTGKSSAAALVLRRAAEARYSVRWTYVPDLSDRLADPALRRQEIRAQAGVDFLVWDDFGVRDFADWEIERLDAIVEQRHSKRRPMIVSTNWTIERLREHPGLARMMDRWRQRMTALYFVGESQRRPAAAPVEQTLLDGTDG